jgi:hypothetical protein
MNAQVSASCIPKSKRRALYPANLRPSWIVHDVTILAAS